MDDYSVTTLHESKNEWCARLVNILTPHIMEGFRSIFDEAYKLCKNNNETDKYLMTFQNFLSRVPKWNPTIVQNETSRIKERSHCGYLEDLITCVHIVQLKTMTAARAGNKQKKVNIPIPQLTEFIHKVYINSARKMYSNVYIFERGIPPLVVQKNNREFEIIVRECIFNTIRENIPMEDLLKLYMDDSIEDAIEVSEKEEVIHKEVIASENTMAESSRRRRSGVGNKPNNGSGNGNGNGSRNGMNKNTGLYNDLSDQIASSETSETPSSNQQKQGVSFGENQVKSFEPEYETKPRRFGDDDDDDDSEGRINIGDSVNLDILDVHSLNQSQHLDAPPLLDDIEFL